LLRWIDAGGGGQDLTIVVFGVDCEHRWYAATSCAVAVDCDVKNQQDLGNVEGRTDIGMGGDGERKRFLDIDDAATRSLKQALNI
jgi:hypothetical protein